MNKPQKQNAQNNFTNKLIEWHLTTNKRTMPWKEEKDPYKIWISEIILQQTRVEQGLLYYNKFIEKFPTIDSLAKATDEIVFKMWEGLGYYSRCKNLIASARFLSENNKGTFPSNYDDILKLKGVGTYTASAISSFAYGLPHAVVDGNVLRVLARYFGEHVPIDSTEGKKFFSSLAGDLLYKKNPAAFNQAIMDFGATICTPQLPKCNHCLFQNDCLAYLKNTVNTLPVKEKSIVRKNRFFTYFVFFVGNKVLVKKRIEKDVWQNLFEFFLFESAEELLWKNKSIAQWLKETLGIIRYDVISISAPYKQQLTHQNLKGRFICIRLTSIPAMLQEFQKIPFNEIDGLAFPKFINSYLCDTLFETMKEDFFATPEFGCKKN